MNGITIDTSLLFTRDLSSNPIPSIPTPLQVFEATQTYIHYSEPNSVVQVCPISLEPFQNGDTICIISHCNHRFKQYELIRWFSRNSQCPVCRHDICV